MRKMLKISGSIAVVVFLLVLGYGGKGWYDATTDGKVLVARAERIEVLGRGVSSLPPDRLAAMLKVQDPSFYSNSGLDLTTKGAGLTTLAQSLAKRLAFDRFTPGIGKVRQTGYAIGLNRSLNKEQQITLFLDTVEMGKGPQGWITGFHNASQTFFGAAPDEITDEQFYSLVAVLIAPSRLKLASPDEELTNRVKRIARLVDNQCEPNSVTDVWLEGCR